MKHLEQLSEALRELTDRYGITITEVPERLCEKILNKVGKDAAADLNVILQPLLANLLRPLRIRAGQRVDKNTVADTVKSIAELEGFDKNLAEPIVDLWASVFRVTVGDFPGLAVDRVSELKPTRDTVGSGMAGAGQLSGRQATPDGKEAIRAREVRKDDSTTHKRKASSASTDIVVKMSFDDNKKTADFMNSGNSERTDKKKAKKSDKLEDLTITPLQPDMMSFNQPAAPDQSTARKPGIDEAFRSLRNGDYQAASKAMMELARAGDTRAQYHLGEFYLMGTG